MKKCQISSFMCLMEKLTLKYYKYIHIGLVFQIKLAHFNFAIEGSSSQLLSILYTVWATFLSHALNSSCFYSGSTNRLVIILYQVDRYTRIWLILGKKDPPSLLLLPLVQINLQGYICRQTFFKFCVESYIILVGKLALTRGPVIFLAPVLN